jgi:arsenite-transporting ATPase
MADDITTDGHLLPSFLADNSLKLLLFGGKGGVGKTSCAVSSAFHFARQLSEANILLVSIDPAHSLVDSIADAVLPDNLTVRELDASAFLEKFKLEKRDILHEIAARGTFFDSEDISGLLDLSLPGLDEVMALLEIADWLERDNWHKIIVDMAPTGHCLQWLAVPALLRQWLETVECLLGKHRYMQTVFGGSEQPDHVDAFITELSNSLEQVELLFADVDRCRFVPIMLAEPLSVNETTRLLAELKEREISASEIIVNRLIPCDTCAICSLHRNTQDRHLENFCRTYPEAQIWAIPYYAKEIRGNTGLTSFWDGCFVFEPCSPQVQSDEIRLQEQTQQYPVIENPMPLPQPDIRLLLLAGKGGVGKTTIACATAIRMAQAYPHKRILLLSTDPAHSLSDCLCIELGTKPVVVWPNLTALELDTTAEFEAFKDLYAHEMERLFGSLGQNYDLSFDRQAMEQIMRLAPPGLDEIMALTRITELLRLGEFDTFVLDPAPTGHFVRLLELPDLMESWLKMLFALFLKYKNMFRLPRLSKYLVDLSKGLKHLRTLFVNASLTNIGVVTIPTQMALAETSDLLCACRRLKMPVLGLFLNMLIPAGDDDLCQNLRSRELEVQKQCQREFNWLHHTAIYRYTLPEGLERLTALAQILYN